MSFQITLSDEVADALRRQRPVVALESTVITHGLPHPINIETALAMEQAVRDGGAVPATVGVIKGEIIAGLSHEHIEYLAQAPAGRVRKCSRRDFAIAVGLKQDAATTVAGTMIVAHKVGIQLFATGGIGGVHRGQPFDVSADLIELGRTPVTVVCAGAKSILDLPLTLEVLETHGVPVLGMQCDHLPAFYRRDSGLPVNQRIDSAAEAARIIHASHALQINHGILIGVPVPEEHELPDDVIDPAIQQATDEAHARGITGNAVTPYILGRVLELTDGKSLVTNQALLVNNGRVAAQIAVALSELTAVPKPMA